MTPRITSLLTDLVGNRGRAPGEECLVCGHAIEPEGPRMRLPGGGHVHRGCSTYSMRHRQRVRRRIGRGQISTT